MTRRLVGLVAVLTLAAGCARPAPKAQLSGTVTFKGQPVPAGYVSFMPDAAQGNHGPVKVAQIKDGVFDTSRAADPGIRPGPTIIRIAGFDGKPQRYYAQGKQIFNPIELRDSIPEGTTTKDFTVPASAAENLRIEPTSDIP